METVNNSHPYQIDLKNKMTNDRNTSQSSYLQATFPNHHFSIDGHLGSDRSTSWVDTSGLNDEQRENDSQLNS